MKYVISILLILLCCGSSHDYSFFDDFNDADFIKYHDRHGIDISIMLSREDNDVIKISLFDINNTLRVLGDSMVFIQFPIVDDMLDYYNIEYRMIYDPRDYRIPEQDVTNLMIPWSKIHIGKHSVLMELKTVPLPPSGRIVNDKLVTYYLDVILIPKDNASSKSLKIFEDLYNYRYRYEYCWEHAAFCTKMIDI